MKTFLGALILVCFVAVPAVARAGEAKSSLDGVDHVAGKSLDAADTGRSGTPDQAPED